MRGEPPLVSVLTPVHDGAVYIEECLRSVREQSFDNWLHTVVDNCSSDATPDLVEKHAREDSRIRLLRFEELVDATENHNRAIEAMEPEAAYCKFLQGDDWLFPQCLERMVEAARAAESIGVVGAYRLVEQGGVDLVGLPYWQAHVSGREILRQSLLGGPYVTGAPSATLLRADLARGRRPFFDPRYRHGDTEALYWVLSQADFGYVHQVLTFARRQVGARSTYSLSVNTYGPENICFLLRYGPSVLTPAEYRSRLRLELRDYVRWHVRQAARPSRLGDSDFLSFHRAASERIVEESNGDRQVRAAMTVVRTLLMRGAVWERVHPRSSSSGAR